MKHQRMKNNKGSMITLTLVFGGIFLFLFAGILGFVLLEYKGSLNQISLNKILRIAEAGVNYSQWHLLHEPDDYDFDLIKDYYLEGEIIGQYQLEIQPPSNCFPSAEIESSAWEIDSPDLKRLIKITYGQAPLTKYAFLTDSDLWIGSSETIKGRLHSNGGVRIDGIQNSLFSSAKEVYTCKPNHGCSPVQEKPGIWGEGDGQDQGLWKFLSSELVSEIDFTVIMENLDELKEMSQSGYYFGDSGSYGYWVEFLGSQFKVYSITELEDDVWAWNTEEWIKESNSIKTYEEIGVYNLPSNCIPIFIEDNVWVSGNVDGRITLIAAKLPYVPSSAAKIIINGDIGYQGIDSALGLVAQKDILIPLRLGQSSLEIRAALLAKNGSVMRYFYPCWDLSPYQENCLLDSIQVNGSIISKKDWTFTWVDESEQVISGYEYVDISIDSNLLYQPPPFFVIPGSYGIINWEEK